MSGNILLKKGQILFREGDSSDGMYLVRKGTLLIYLEKGEKVVDLAKVEGGAMIGEMALFDKKPRSASAKAVADSEVTKISNDDFKKIMKQIPKWFVALMASLSTRLRETNERLQKLEGNKGGPEKLEQMITICHLLVLLWHKEGSKDQKSWNLERDTATTVITSQFSMAQDIVCNTIDALIKAKVISSHQDNYNKEVLSIANRGHLEKYAAFLKTLLKSGLKSHVFSQSSMQFIEVISDIVKDSAYDNATLTLADISLEGERRAYTTDRWKSHLVLLKAVPDVCNATKVGDQIGFKIKKDKFPRIVSQFHALHLMLDAA